MWKDEGMAPSQPALAEANASAQPRLTITPATGVIGAWVTGLDTSADYSPEVREVLARAMHEHGVLFHRVDHQITPEEHVRLSEVFGPLHQKHFQGEPLPSPTVIDNAKRANVGTEIWHTDTTVVANPPAASVLRTPVLPAVGGDTIWASMYAAYEALSSRMQRFLEGLEAIHTSDTLLRQRPSARASGLYPETLSATHPVVIRDPVTRKPALYINRNYVSEIVGLSDNESASLLKMLFDHVNTPDFHVRLKWDTRTYAIWDERVTQHRAIADYEGRRVLKRYWIMGPPPVAASEGFEGART
jgi:taurine dioxygenase